MPDKLTNEETRLALYGTEGQPTIPSTVRADTPLESLNLNWSERDLPERERTKHVHRLHPYLGKFIPQLAEVFLRKFFVPGQTVFDPFVGSGTTLVQANELGINAIGCDISAFNIVLCRAKTTCYDLHRLRSEVTDALKKAQAKSVNDFSQLPLFAHTSPNGDGITNHDQYLDEWYAPSALKQLIAYRDTLENGRYEYKDLLRTILCRAARSARLTTHFDLDFPKKPQTESYWCYKHSRMCFPVTDAAKFLKRYSDDALRRVRQFANIRTDAAIQLDHTDSREVTLPSVDGIITSPPYVGLIDYHEQHAYAYHLLKLEDRRDREIGAASAGSGKKAQSEYQSQIAAVFRNAMKVMPSGGRLIVIAADKANLYSEIAEMIDVKVEAVIQRHVNRRTGRRAREFYESIYVWQKA